MARVNFEEHGFGDGRLALLARALGGTIREAVGTLVLLWRDSQEQLRISGTKDEIVDWCRVVSDAEGEHVFAALIRARYLAPIETGKLSGQFEIRGNKTQIDMRIKNMERGKKGGRATYEKWKKEKRDHKIDNEVEDLTEGLKPSARQASATLEAQPPNATQPNAKQPKATQCSAIQNTEERSGGEEKKTTGKQVEKRPVKPVAPNQNIVARYCELWKHRYGANPLIGGKAAGQLKTLLRDYGEEKSIKLLEAYLSMPDAWFVTKRHDVGTLMQNVNVVSHFMETRRTVTRRDINNLDSAVHTQNLLDAVDRGEI